MRYLLVLFFLIFLHSTDSLAHVAFRASIGPKSIAHTARTGLGPDIVLWTESAGTAHAGGTLYLTYQGVQVSSLATIAIALNGNPIFGKGSPQGSFSLYGTNGSQTADIGTTSSIFVTVTVYPTGISIFNASDWHFEAGDMLAIEGIRLNVIPFTRGSLTNYFLMADFTTGNGELLVINPLGRLMGVFHDPISVSSGEIAIIAANGVVDRSMGSVLISENFPTAFETVGVNNVDATKILIRIRDIPKNIVLQGASIGGETSGSIQAVVSEFNQEEFSAWVTVLIQAQIPSAVEQIEVDLRFAAGEGNVSLGSARAAATLGPEATVAELDSIVNNGPGIPFNPPPLTGGNRYFPDFKPSVRVLSIREAPTMPELTVRSVNPAHGISITVSPLDDLQQGNEITPFTRTYNKGTSVTLSAPSSGDMGIIFRKWKLDGIDLSTQRSITLTLQRNHTVTAVYMTQRRRKSRR